MKVKSFLAIVLATLGTVLLLFAVGFAFWNRNAAPQMALPQQARVLPETFLGAIKEGNLTAAGELCLGKHQWAPRQTAREHLVAKLQMAYYDSFRFELLSGASLKDGVVQQSYRISYLDLPELVQQLGQKAHAELTERVASAEDMDELYDSQGDFRQELMTQVMETAVDACLPTATSFQGEGTLELRYQDGNWWIVPDAAILQFLSADALN